eukprot:UN00867
MRITNKKKHVDLADYLIELKPNWRENIIGIISEYENNIEIEMAGSLRNRVLNERMDPSPVSEADKGLVMLCSPSDASNR